MKPEHRTSLAYALPEWLRAPILPLLLGKELRVLMPVWLLTSRSPPASAAGTTRACTSVGEV